MYDTFSQPERCAGDIPAFLEYQETDSRAPAIVLMHERYGLVQHTRNLTERYARDGYVCIAPDFFHKHPDQAALHRGEDGYDISDSEAVAFLEAAMAHLIAVPRVDPARIAVTGVCQTGRHPLLLAAQRPNAAATSWYRAASAREWQISPRTPQTLVEIIT